MIDKDGVPVQPGWLWLDARAASLAARLVESPGYSRHYATTGTGRELLPTGRSTRLDEGAPAQRPPGRRDRLHCKDWIYFPAHRRARDRSFGSAVHLRQLPSREYDPVVMEHLGISDLRRLLPEIVDGTQTHHKLDAQAAAETGLAAGTPVVLGYVDVLCTGLGGGLYDESGEVGCSIIGSTGMHMRFVADPAEVRLNPERSGYTMAFPVPGAVAQIQSNMAPR
jgi:erythritol kinase